MALRQSPIKTPLRLRTPLRLPTPDITSREPAFNAASFHDDLLAEARAFLQQGQDEIEVMCQKLVEDRKAQIQKALQPEIAEIEKLEKRLEETQRTQQELQLAQQRVFDLEKEEADREGILTEQKRKVQCLQSTIRENERKHGESVRDLQAKQRAQKDRHNQQKLMDAGVRELLTRITDFTGLSIKLTDQQTAWVSFIGLVPTQPHPEVSFSFLLRLPGGGKKTYTVSSCFPTLPDLESLVDQLNASRDTRDALPRFMVSVREAFKAVAAAHVANRSLFG